MFSVASQRRPHHPGSAVGLCRHGSEIIAHGEAMADDFEQNPPDPAQAKDGAPLWAIAAAARARAAAEQEVADAVAAAPSEGVSWNAIGMMLGTSGQAARQRYGAIAS